MDEQELQVNDQNWKRISRLLDFIQSQPIQERSASYRVKEEVPQSIRRRKKPEQEAPAEQLRLF
jgi:hypothetical protein